MSTNKKFTVAVMGAAGGIGQPLSMLLKSSPLVGDLNLYDVVPVVKGVAVDISHMNTSGKVRGFAGPDELAESLKGVDLVVIPAGVPRKPGMTRDDLFNINAGIVLGLAEAVAANSPNAWVNIILNPVNSTVPIAAQAMKKAGAYDPKKVFGVTKLDVVRAEMMLGEALGVPPEEVKLPVIGGHAGITILPLLSQATPKANLAEDQAKALTDRIANAGTEVVEAKAGAGSATLSMAYAAYLFAESCLRAMSGESGVEECAYVESNVQPDIPFFASRLKLGKDGIEEYLPIGPVNDLESKILEEMKPELLGSIQKGLDFKPKPKQ